MSMTAKARALKLAAELGVELDTEPDEDGWMIEIWSYNAHLTEDPIGQSHTRFVHHDEAPTAAGKWREALRYMAEDLVPCPDDCECRKA